MKLEMEFIHRKRIPALGLAFLAIIAGLGVIQFAGVSDLHAKIDEKQERIAKLERSVQQRDRAASASPVATPEQELRNKQRQAMLQALRYPWNRALSTVEQNDQKDVAILSFSHSQIGNFTQLSVEGADVAALVTYVNGLNDSEDEIRWYLASHQVQIQKSPATVKGEILRK